MPLDFPSNPINGQTYDNYYWDASSNAWRSSGTKAGLQPRVTALELANATTNRSGLVPIVPTSVDKSGGTATANAVGQVTFTGVSSVSLNGVFTSDYTNYKIVITAGSGSTGTDMRLRMRAAGTDRTNANYYSGGMLVREQGSSTAIGNTGATNFDIARLLAATNSNSSIIDVNMPQVSSSGSSVHFDTWANDGSGGYSLISAGLYSTANANDGFTFYSSGTFSGIISTYGYND